jgi:hypothetical protein
VIDSSAGLDARARRLPLYDWLEAESRPELFEAFSSEK